MIDPESLPVVKGLRVEVKSLREAYNAEKEKTAALVEALALGRQYVADFIDNYGVNDERMTEYRADLKKIDDALALSA